MIVYRELSSLSADLGFSAKALYSAGNHIERHYHKAQIPKGNGEFRWLTVPDGFLKAIQKSIHENLLCFEPISQYAAAYRPGGSTLVNAKPHVGREMILKMDIRHFFDNLIYPLIKDAAFPENRYSEANRILLSILCTYQGVLPQGAPTSPAISNIVMRGFDDAVGSWCRERSIRYSRYCDDMTFSGDFDPKPAIAMVSDELRKLGLFLNDKKTVAARKGQRQTVTGIVVNEKPGISSDYKRKLRQELHYCMKFGTRSHLDRLCSEMDGAAYLARLLGRVNYVLSVEPENSEMRNYRSWITSQQKGET